MPSVQYTGFDTSYYQDTEFNHERLVSVIEGWVRGATLQQKLEANAWYWNAHNFARELARRYHLTLVQSSALVAVLSPGTRWSQNCKDAEAFAKAAKNGEEMPSATTYAIQARKAWHIVKYCKNIDAEAMESMIGSKAAKKTVSFFWNIFDPTKRDIATIDRWMMRAALIDRDAPTSKQYDAIAWAVIEVARKRETQAHKIQALVWLAVQENEQPKDIEHLPF
jgi:hypothetical protein